MDPAEAAHVLSSAVAKNTSVEALRVAPVDSFYRAAILRGLAEHTRIQTHVGRP